MASRQRIRQDQILRNFISWKNRTFELVRMSWKCYSASTWYCMGENPDLHEEPARIRYSDLDRNFVTVLVFSFRHIECWEDRRGDNENCRIDQMASRADPLANTKCQWECWVVSDAPIFVEKSLRLEFPRVWVYLWVMQDSPKTSQIGIQMDRQQTNHAFAITIDPLRPGY